MPCYYTGSAEGDARLEASEARAELTKTTRMLCKIVDYLRDAGETDVMDKLTMCVEGFGGFVEQHDYVDAKRREREKNAKQRAELKKSAKAKLTKAELRALMEK